MSSSAAAAAADSATQVAKKVRRASPQKLRAFLAGLEQHATELPHRLPPGTERVRFLVKNDKENTPNKIPSLPNRRESRFTCRLAQPGHLSMLAYYNPKTLFEFEYRKKDIDPNAADASLSPDHQYFTREFLDVWQKGASKPSRHDITGVGVESILARICLPINVSDQEALPLPTEPAEPAESIPLEEGPELDAYIARSNAAMLAEYRASGKLANMEARRAEMIAEMAGRKLAAEENAAQAAAQTDDSPAEGLELFTLDDLSAPAKAAGDAAASSDGATADDFEHSTSAWDAIEKKMKDRSEGEAPPSS